MLYHWAATRGSLYLLLHGTQGEEEEGHDQHALHWNKLQGGLQEEPPLGQEADHDTQDSQAQNFTICNFIVAKLSPSSS